MRLGDNVIRDTSKVFQPKYKNFCITGFLGKNQIEVKDNHGHTTKVHMRNVKKIPMTDNISQMYEEEQINKTRNGRKLVPDNKMLNLHWNLEKQETTHKEEIKETEETNRLNRTLEVIIYMMIFIYSCILQIQGTVFQYTKTVVEVTQHTPRNLQKSVVRITRQTQREHSDSINQFSKLGTQSFLQKTEAPMNITEQTNVNHRETRT